MDNSLKLAYIKKCLILIEQKLNWGDSNEWTGYDFERLSVEIQMETGVVLSITTLKRIWGKLKYANIPTATTLNTLAKFAGYNNWRAFESGIAQPQEPITVPDIPASSTRGQKAVKRWLYWFLGLSALLLISYVAFLYVAKTEAGIDTSAYKFSSNKIKTEGVPNSVIFNYDATAANTDSIFITQSWDVSRKVTVPKQKNVYSTIYYNPGYFRAKLIVGKQIVKEHDLMISSDGWLAMIYNKGGIPIYFKKAEVLKNNEVEVNEKLLSQYNVPLQPSLPALRFFNVKEMGDIRNDHFTFETMLKSDFHSGNAACQRVDILIICKDDVIIIPLSSKGCVGDLSLYVAGTTIQSKTADLSKFGCDLNQWVKLRVERKDRQMRLFVNDEEAYSLPVNAEASDIVGIQYRFNGTGAVKSTRFTRDKQVINF